VVAEPNLSERPVVHLVQHPPGIGEILASQAGSSRRAKPISWAGL
jgi:hypothetical protein